MYFDRFSNSISLNRVIQSIVAITILWTYNTKMISPTVDSISSMSRSYVINDVEQNPAYYETSTMSSIILFTFLFFFMLARNDIMPAIKSRNFNLNLISKSIAALIFSLIVIIMLDNLDFTPSKGTPFLLIGTPIVMTLMLVLDGVKVIPDKKIANIHPLLLKVDLPTLIFLLFLIMALNIAFVPPIISSDLPFHSILASGTVLFTVFSK